MNNLRKGLSFDRLVAHRGYPAHYPENTLGALRAALELGAKYVEFDVQMSSDGVPVVFHDEDLLRIAGVEGRVMDWSLTRLQQIPLPVSHDIEHIPTVSEIGELLKDWPLVTAFIEIKPESILHFGMEEVVNQTILALQPILSQCVIISYEIEALRHAHTLGAPAIGWVLNDWNKKNRQTAERLRPNYLFLDHTLIPSTTIKFWPGPWRWVVYEVETPEHGYTLLHQGADLLETTNLALLAEIESSLESGKASA